MTIAESDGMRLAYIAEVTEGTTPATPAWQTLRYVSESIKAQKQTTNSAEIRADKNLSDVLHVGDSVNGGINGELSYATYDDFFEACFRGAWTGDVLKNALIRKSFSFEKTTEEGATDSYMKYRGCFIDSIALSIQPRSPITIDTTIMGLGADDAVTAIVTGATYVAANDNEVMPSGTYIGTISVGGISALPAIKGIEMTFASNNREQTQIGSNDLAGIALGRFEVSGSLDLYFEGIEVYNAIRAHDTATITIPLGSVTGEKYELVLPAIKFLEGDPVSGGNGQDVAFSVGFQAIFDSAEGCSAKLTRAVA
jgi:hypothetical protein